MVHHRKYSTPMSWTIFYLNLGMMALGVGMCYVGFGFFPAFDILSELMYGPLLVMFRVLPICLALLGSLLVVSAAIGACLIRPNMRKASKLLAMFYFLYTTLMFILAIICYIAMKAEGAEMLRLSTNQTIAFLIYYDDDPTPLDYLQQKYKCCGFDSAKDWEDKKIPRSCCRTDDVKEVVKLRRNKPKKERPPPPKKTTSKKSVAAPTKAPPKTTKKSKRAAKKRDMAKVKADPKTTTTEPPPKHCDIAFSYVEGCDEPFKNLIALIITDVKTMSIIFIALYLLNALVMGCLFEKIKVRKTEE